MWRLLLEDRCRKYGVVIMLIWLDFNRVCMECSREKNRCSVKAFSDNSRARVWSAFMEKWERVLRNLRDCFVSSKPSRQLAILAVGG
ncbi:hypothetical protein AVEN_37735-1 [Araneus ventricosus]|uniref:Uncharacterized protein n=1 Tax=Araneus ventricosus TaxID=182803 RepID=A0A4Y2BSU1_ARAVE|nr:hypothetical protein AVEN_37735-1 [Araneus ventricosus]